MFKILNKLTGIQGVLAVLLFGVFILLFIVNYSFSSVSDVYFFANGLFDYLYAHKVVGIGFTILTLIVQLLLLRIVINRNKFLPKSSFLPIIFYLILLIGSGAYREISHIFYNNTFVLLILLLNSEYSVHDVKRKVFLSGLIIGFVACVDFAFIVIAVFVIISLIINFISKTKDVLIFFLGISVSVLYVTVYYFFTDQMEIVQQSLHTIASIHLSIEKFTISTVELVFLLISFLLLIINTLRLRSQYENKIIIMRKRLSTLNFLFYIQIFALILTNLSYPIILQYLFVPISIYLGLLSQNKSKYLMEEIIVSLIIVGLCL